MTPIHALILGIVQGFTEFLPVSSSGHLVLTEHLLGDATGGLTFEIWLHLATLVAVVAALHRDLRRLIVGLVPGGEDTAFARRWVPAIVLGTVPAVLVGLFLKDQVEAVFSSVRWVGADLLLTATILLASRFFPARNAPLTLWRSLTIGVGQALAILPGVSRSGTTLATGVTLGLSGPDAARFSFILSVPVILGAVVLELPALAKLGAASPLVLVAGFVSAAACGYLAIRVVWRVMEQRRLAWFAPYCAILGVIVLIWG